VQRTINTPFFSLTKPIHDAKRGAFMLRQGNAANIRTRWIRRRLRVLWPLEPAIRLDQQLGKTLNKDFGEAARRHLRDEARCAAAALR
jgi:hypothetical protein